MLQQWLHPKVHSSKWLSDAAEGWRLVSFLFALNAWQVILCWRPFLAKRNRKALQAATDRHFIAGGQQTRLVSYKIGEPRAQVWLSGRALWTLRAKRQTFRDDRRPAAVAGGANAHNAAEGHFWVGLALAWLPFTKVHCCRLFLRSE